MNDEFDYGYASTFGKALSKTAGSYRDDYGNNPLAGYNALGKQYKANENKLDSNKDTISKNFDRSLGSLEDNTPETLIKNEYEAASKGTPSEIANAQALSRTEQARSNTASQILDTQQASSKYNKTLHDYNVDTLKSTLSADEDSTTLLLRETLNEIDAIPDKFTFKGKEYTTTQSQRSALKNKVGNDAIEALFGDNSTEAKKQQLLDDIMGR